MLVADSTFCSDSFAYRFVTLDVLNIAQCRVLVFWPTRSTASACS